MQILSSDIANFDDVNIIYAAHLQNLLSVFADVAVWTSNSPLSDVFLFAEKLYTSAGKFKRTYVMVLEYLVYMSLASMVSFQTYQKMGRNA